MVKMSDRGIIRMEDAMVAEETPDPDLTPDRPTPDPSLKGGEKVAPLPFREGAGG